MMVLQGLYVQTKTDTKFNFCLFLRIPRDGSDWKRERPEPVLDTSSTLGPTSRKHHLNQDESKAIIFKDFSFVGSYENVFMD